MSTETYKDVYEKPESFFGRYEEEYRIAGRCAAIRLMQAISSSKVLKEIAYSDKSVPAFTHSICDDLVRTHLGFAELVNQWLASTDNNTNRIKALETFGIVEVLSKQTPRYGLRGNFELALELEFNEDQLIDDIKKDSDFGRHDAAIDFFVGFYMQEIEQKRKGNRLSIDYLVPTALGNIEFYVGHEDPRQYQ